MVRVRHDDPSRFLAADIAAGTGIEAENLKFLRRHQVGPFARRNQTGAFYHEDTVAELAMIAAMNGLHVPLRLAAAVVDAYCDCHTGTAPAHMGRLDDLDLTYRRGHRTWFRAYARAIGAGGALVDRLATGQAQDRLVLLLDTGDVAEWALDGWAARVLPALDEDTSGPLPMGRITGLHRNGQPRFHPHAEALSHQPPEMQPAFEAHQRRRLQSALRDSCATLTVNLSLAVRRAFAAIYAHRKATGGPLWSEAT